MTDLETFLAAYIECALWSTTDESNDNGGDPLDLNYSADDIDDVSVAAMRKDCEAFLTANAADIGDRVEEAGHDFWLNRNGHGCGFWDGDWPEEAGDRMDKASEAFGEVSLYVGDDGKIYQSGAESARVPAGERPEGDGCGESPCSCFF